MLWFSASLSPAALRKGEYPCLGKPSVQSTLDSGVEFLGTVIPPSCALPLLKRFDLLRGRVAGEPQRAGGEGEELRRFPSPMTR